MPVARTYQSNADKQRAYRQRLQERKQSAALAGTPHQTGPANIMPTARWNALRVTAIAALSTLRDEMQTYYDDRSEKWQESDRADTLQERLDALEEMLETLEGME